MEKAIIAFSFDDGRLDNYTNAYPILKKHHLPATFNITSGYIKGNIDQIKNLINFAVLCLYSSNKICGKELESNTKNILNQTTKSKNKPKKKSNKDSKVSTDIETRMSNMEAKMDNMEKRMDNLEKRMDNMEAKMNKMESDIASIKTMVSELVKMKK